MIKKDIVSSNECKSRRKNRNKIVEIYLTLDLKICLSPKTLVKFKLLVL